MKSLLTLIVIVCISLSVFAVEPVSDRPEFVNQLAKSDGNQNAAATAWGTCDNAVWFLYLDDSGYMKLIVDSNISPLKTSKRFDVYSRTGQTIVIGDTAWIGRDSQGKIQGYLKELKKLLGADFAVKEILKS
jgi:hypothetical protein